jgi:uncharacterized protein (TIGR03066 family)
MSAMRLLALALTLGVVGTSGALVAEDNKADVTKEKLQGTWESVKADPGTLPAGSLLELAKDGKLKITAKKGNETDSIEGTWALTGDKVTISVKVDGNERKTDLTVKKLTATELAVADDMGKSVEFKKK